MTAIQDHYEHLLAEHYTWMFGMPFEKKVAEQARALTQAGVARPGLAVDLGCGPGFQSIALADMGATQVHAIDTSSTLLAELRSHAGRRPITTHRADLMTFDGLIDRRADTIVCMGDTLTHLASLQDVSLLLNRVAQKLTEGGKLVLSWRDLSGAPAGLDRFIPLRSTDSRIMTCFLEDQGEKVMVHDLIHVKEAGDWVLRKSCYPKLKLTRQWVGDALAGLGFAPVFENTVNGLTFFSAKR